MFWKRDATSRDDEDRALRRLFGAASVGGAREAEADERRGDRGHGAVGDALGPASGPASEPPPFFVARVRARIAEAERERGAGALAAPGAVPGDSIGATALAALPALGLAVAVLSAWTGYETVRADREREAAVSRMLSGREGLGDVVIAAYLLGDATDAGGSR